MEHGSGTESGGDRLTRLSAASLRINESLDVDTALRAVMEGACSLTNAPMACIITLDESGAVEDHRVLGFEPGDAERLWEAPQGQMFFEYLNALAGPLRIGRLEEFTASIGFGEFRSPVKLTAFMAAPMLHQAVRAGHIYVGSDEPGREFTREDEEILVMFASQAALVISNARRHREERRARADLETVIATSPVGVVVFDMQDRASMSFNPEALRIVDHLRDPGQTLEELLEVQTVRRADGSVFSIKEFPLFQVLSSGEKVRSEEITMMVPDGRSVTALVNATPIHSEEGDLETVVVTMQDMAPVEEQERLRAEFLATVSHELRMPITSIRGAATALLEASKDLDPAETRQFHRIIVDRADHMRELIGDLLDVARIETGTLPVDLEPVEMTVLLDRARVAFSGAGEMNELAIDFAPNLPLVMADRQRIVQVMLNLLSNAARHSPDSSPIKVSAERVGEDVEISVSDEGRGIPVEDLPLLFRKFSRLERGDTASENGLGLAICKGIVEAHGGRIWAESDGPDLGARFTFTLPVAQDSELALRLASPRVGEGTEGTVLVVDDDPLVLRSVRDALSSEGFDVVVTAESQEVLNLLAEHNPAIAVLDLMLPERDGTEVMGDILAVSRIPIVFLSAYGRDELVARVLEMGATDYIVKPFSPTELVARVRAALRRSGEQWRRQPEEPFVLDDLTVDYATRRATVSGLQAGLTPIEFDLLAELAMSAGRVVTHEQLLRRVWSPAKPGNMRVLRTHMMRLRRKLGETAENPKYIFAERRVGYRMPEGEGQEPSGDESETGDAPA